MSNTMQAIAGAAAIGQEPITVDVRFAITGDPETDLIAGVMAVLNSGEWAQSPITANPITDMEHRQDRLLTAHRVMKYLAERFSVQAQHLGHRIRKIQDEQEAQYKLLQQQQQLLGTAGTPAPPSHYYTTSGTLLGPPPAPAQTPNPYGGIDKPMVLDWLAKNPFTTGG